MDSVHTVFGVEVNHFALVCNTLSYHAVLLYDPTTFCFTTAVITCPLLKVPKNGKVTYSVDTERQEIGFGATATYSCNHESLGVNGDRVRVCGPGHGIHGYHYYRDLIGVWSGGDPTCECECVCV